MKKNLQTILDELEVYIKANNLPAVVAVGGGGFFHGQMQKVLAKIASTVENIANDSDESPTKIALTVATAIAGVETRDTKKFGKPAANSFALMLKYLGEFSGACAKA